MHDLLIHHANTPDGTLDLAIEDGVITAAGPSLGGAAREVIDASGLQVWPGFIDAHVHFNEPGRTDWEGFATGSRALAAGGGTAFFDMPLNSDPPTATVQALESKRQCADQHSILDYGLWGALIPGNENHLDGLAAAGVIGFKAFLSGSGIAEFPSADESVLRAGMKRAAAWHRIVALHAEDPRIIDALTRQARASGRTGIRDYLDSRPVEAECSAIRLALALAGETGCALHIVHVSSPEGLELIAEGAAAGVDVTAETCPHYLLLNGESVGRIGAAAKCAPPLRDEARRQLLWKALAEERIQTLGSDHSPAPASLKESPDFFEVWGGIAGCQHGFLLTLAEALLDRGFHAKNLSPLLSRNVAARFRLGPAKGGLKPGQDADLVLLQPRPPHPIQAAELLTRHPISAYTGLPQRYHAVRTISRGNTVWPLPQGSPPPRARWLKPVLE